MIVEPEPLAPQDPSDRADNPRSLRESPTPCSRTAHRLATVVMVIACTVPSIVALTFNPFSDYVFGDQATHALAAFSVAFDGDLEFQERDLLRFSELTPWRQPDGLLLKKSSDGKYYFAKPNLYAILTAPLSRLLGFKGIILTNAILLTVMMTLAFLHLEKQIGRVLATALTVAFFLPAPFIVWVCVAHPDLQYGTLLLVSIYFLFRYMDGRRTSSLVIFGLAAAISVFEKPPFVVVFASLLPIFVMSKPSRRASIAAFLAAASALAALTSVNYFQDGNLSPYVGVRGYYTNARGGFPFEQDFDGSTQERSADGSRIFTPQFVARGLVSRIGNLPEMARESMLGRQTGVFIYFPTAIVFLVLLALSLSRSRTVPVWLGFGGYLVFYALLFPENTYGGTTSFGNRYAMQAMPMLVFTLSGEWIPWIRGRKLAITVTGSVLAAIVFAVFVQGKALIDPSNAVANSRRFTASWPRTLFAIEYAQLKTIFGGVRGYPWSNGTMRIYPVNEIPRIRQETGFSLPARGQQVVVFEADNEVSSVDVVVSAGGSLQLCVQSETETVVLLTRGQSRTVEISLGPPEAVVRTEKGVRYFQKVVFRVDTTSSSPAAGGIEAPTSDGEGFVFFPRISAVQSPSTTGGRHFEGLQVRFAKGEKGVEYLGRGWSEPEGWGVWSLGSSSRLRIPLACRGRGDLVARFQVGAYVNERRPRAFATVFVEGTKVAEWSKSSPGFGQLEAVIPGFACSDDTIEFLVEHVAAASPQSLGRGGDDRPLNISLTSLTIAVSETAEDGR